MQTSDFTSHNGRTLSSVVRSALLTVAQLPMAYLMLLAPILAGPASTSSESQSLRIVPAEIELWGSGASQRILVLATDAQGLEKDVTADSLLHISDSHLAQLSGDGRLSAIANGRSTLRAKHGAHVTSATVTTHDTAITRPFSFPLDVVGVLTRQGCNRSDCHGGVTGRGGFKLSLNGVSPRDDYRWIVEGGVYQVLSPEAAGPIEPRVDLDDFEESLIVLKPTLSIPHEGGERLAPHTEEHAALLAWIADGAPYASEVESGPPTLQRIEVFPQLGVIPQNGSRRLLVTAHLTNGQRVDFSERVRYESDNPDVLTVTEDGVVVAHKLGEAVVSVQAPGHRAVARLGVVDSSLTSYPNLAPRNLIDEHIFSKLQRLRILPSEKSSDHEFLRRVCLDLTGTLPPAQGAREFLANSDPNKRDELIEVLLNSPEHVNYLTFRFSDFYRVTYRNVLNYKVWIRESLASNKPYDEMAREYIAAQGNVPPTRQFYRPNGGLMYPKEKMAEDVRLFLGVRMDCAECHDHPFEPWNQDQFWGLAAFYGRTTRIQKHGLFFEDPAGNTLNPEGARVMHPRRGVEVQPTFFDGTPLTDAERTEPRMQLAKWVTAPGNPYFARAIVNRIWSYFFVRGFVEPVDDFRDSNPPTHPLLLEALARNFEENGYDLKHLMRLILQSKTYQLSGIPNETNVDDEINYSRARPRRLDAEVLLDAITRVTDSDDPFKVHDYVGGGVEPADTLAIDLTAEVSPSQFLDVFGRPPFREAVPVRDRSVTLGQALHTLVGAAFNDKLLGKEGRLRRLLDSGVSDTDLITEFYLAALSRFPTREELSAILNLLQSSSTREEGFENLVWALIASREFTYNH